MLETSLLDSSPTALLRPSLHELQELLEDFLVRSTQQEMISFRSVLITVNSHFGLLDLCRSLMLDPTVTVFLF